MTFQSILFPSSEDRLSKETLQVPDFSLDLNLNQIIDAITASKEEYNLKPFFYTSLHDIHIDPLSSCYIPGPGKYPSL